MYKHSTSTGNSLLEKTVSVSLCTREASLSLRLTGHYHDTEKLIKHKETRKKEHFFA